MWGYGNPYSYALHQFESIAERVIGEEAANGGIGTVPRDTMAGGSNSGGEIVDADDGEGRVRLARRLEFRFDAAMQFLRAGLDPDAAARRESRWLRKFLHAKQRHVERATRIFGVRRHCDLHVVDPLDLRSHHAASLCSGRRPSR